MTIRLALVERDLSVARCTHSLLVDTPVTRTGTGASTASAELAVRMLPVNLHLYALSTVSGIHLDGLRLKQAIREDSPDLAQQRVEALDKSIKAFRSGGAESSIENWLERYLDELQDSLDEMGWWRRTVFQRSHHAEIKSAAVRMQDIRENELRQVLDAIRDWSETMEAWGEAGHRQSIVFYRDRNGSGDLQAFYTDDLRLDPAQYTQRQSKLTIWLRTLHKRCKRILNR